MDPALPKIVGQPRNAQLNVHGVRMPNALDGINLGGIDAGLRNLAGAMLDLHSQEEDLRYREALNSAVAETDRRLNEEVFSQRGFGTSGSLEKAARIFQEAEGRYIQGLSGRNARKFREAFGARKNTQVSSIMDYERGQLHGAHLNANQQSVQNELQLYSTTLDSQCLIRVKEVYDDSFRRVNGRVTSGGSLAAFDRELEKGGDRIALPDGRSYKITETDTGEAGAISKDRLKRLREDMGRQAEAYESGLQDLYDAAHASVVDQYLKDNRVSAAETYLAQVTEEGYAHPLSEKAANVAADAVKRCRESVDISLQVEEGTAKLRSVGGRYGSTDQDAAYADFIAYVRRKYAGEEEAKGREIISRMETGYRILQHQQKASLTKDVTAALKQMQESAIPLPEQSTMISTMADSALKDALLKAHERKVEAFNNQTDPYFLAAQEQTLNRFKLDVARGEAELDGVHYNFSDPAALKSYIINLGLTDKNAGRALDYINAAGKRLDAYQAGIELAKLIGVDSPYAALERYPNLIGELEYRKGNSVIDDKDLPQWLRANIADLLRSPVGTPSKNPFGEDRAKTQQDYLDKDVAEEDRYMAFTPAIDAWRRAEASKALQRGDLEAAQRALKARPQTPNHLRDFMDRSGYEERKTGYFYLKRPKEEQKQ